MDIFSRKEAVTAIPMEGIPPSVIEPESTEKKKDPWDIDHDNNVEHKPWGERTIGSKTKFVTIVFSKLILVFAFLYLFICSLGLMGSAFQVLAGKTAGDIFKNKEVLFNPVAGVIIGILVTVLVQSSSTSTSIFISMTAVGLINVRQGIPLIMGANIGTSVTNTIVSLSQSMDREEFRRSFGGATVHDVFNLLSVVILLPIELVSGYLEILTSEILKSFEYKKGEKPELLKVITKPLTKKIISVNKTIIKLAAKNEYLEPESSMVKIWCERRSGYLNRTELVSSNMTERDINGENVTIEVFENITKLHEVKVGVTKCESGDFLFANTGMSDAGVGSILLVVSLIAMCICLFSMVKLLSSILKGSIAKIIKKTINTNFPSPFGWLTGYLAMLVGAALTFLVQSSSVFTSTMTPLVGIGVISLKRMYPLTLGSNIGTTTTGLLAALASPGDELKFALQLALCHFFFNISGIIIWYPIPYLRNIPIRAAKSLGDTTANHRWFAVIYLIFVFFLLPALLLGFSFAHPWVLWSFVILVVIIIISIIVINTLQSRKPEALPDYMRTWNFLPKFMHSLKPYDKIFGRCCKCSGIKKCFAKS